MGKRGRTVAKKRRPARRLTLATIVDAILIPLAALAAYSMYMP
jgi:hypothetical protein